MSDLLLDIRYALRTFRSSPGFAGIAVATLAIGLAANATIFGMVHAIILKPLPYGDPDELMIVWRTRPQHGQETGSISAADFADVRERNRIFEGMAAQAYWEVNLTGIDRPERLTGYRVTGNLFDVLGVEAALGRTFRPDEDVPGSPRVAVLTHRIWASRFGSDRSLIGETIDLDGEPHTVVGVTPPALEYPQFQFPGDVFAPLQLTAEQLTGYRGRENLVAVGRLRDGVSRAQAQADVARVAARLEEEHPETDTGKGLRVIGIQEQMAEPILPALIVTMVAVGFVLLICCANVANLLLARTSARGTEIALRESLGATRSRLVRQLLTESAVLAMAGAFLGYGLSVWSGSLIQASLPDVVHRVAGSAVGADNDWKIFGFTFAAALLTAVVFGLAPALRSTKGDFREVLSAGAARASGARHRSRLRGALIAGEIALSVILAVGAALMVKGFVGLVQADPGFDSESALTFRLKPPDSNYPDPESKRRFYRNVIDEIETLPGVEQAATINLLPMSFSDTATSFLIDGRPEPEPGAAPHARRRAVTPGYFDTMRIELLRGRTFTAADDAEDAPPVVIVDDALARRYFPDQDPLGQRIRRSGDEASLVIVGEVEGVRHSAMETIPYPTFYYPLKQAWNTDVRSMSVVARSGVDPESLTESARRRVWAVDPDQPVEDVQLLKELVDVSLFVLRMPTTLMSVFAVVALLLAAVGLYGVVSYLVVQRTTEIGIRVALGASRRDVIGMVLRQAATMTGLGLAFGIVVAYLLGRVLASVLTGVESTEPAILVGVPLFLAGVATFAAWVPARRASGIDPMSALRNE